MNSKLIVLLLLTICLVQSEKFLEELKSENTVDYTFYFFSREWAGTVCKSKPCTKADSLNYNGSNFNIHGLWPNGKPSDNCFYPQQCRNYKYNQSLLSSFLLNKMSQNYVGLYSDSASFRAHEFEKHGTCWNPSSENLQLAQYENEYFGKVEDLYSQYDLMEALKTKNIVPSNTQNYTVAQINSALYTHFNAPTDSIRLECQGVDHVPHLLSIDMCLDMNYKIITCKCDTKISNPCNPSKEVMIPVFAFKQIQEEVQQQTVQINE